VSKGTVLKRSDLWGGKVLILGRAQLLDEGGGGGTKRGTREGFCEGWPSLRVGALPGGYLVLERLQRKIQRSTGIEYGRGVHGLDETKKKNERFGVMRKKHLLNRKRPRDFRKAERTKKKIDNNNKVEDEERRVGGMEDPGKRKGGNGMWDRLVGLIGLNGFLPAQGQFRKAGSEEKKRL